MDDVLAHDVLVGIDDLLHDFECNVFMNDFLHFQQLV